MRPTRQIFTLAAILSALGTTPALAATAYVTDQLEITLRAGESTKYKILRMLPSGTRLEVLGVNAKTGYTHVRAPEGTSGYVLARQLQDEPVARAQIDEMKTRLDELLREPESLARELAELQTAHRELTQEASLLAESNRQLTQQLTDIRQASANVVEITQDRARLAAEVDTLSQERVALLQENEALRQDSNQRWFMIGGGVLGGGVILGLILPHLRAPRRKSSWDRL